jgi:hypothetical protein
MIESMLVGAITGYLVWLAFKMLEAFGLAWEEARHNRAERRLRANEVAGVKIFELKASPHLLCEPGWYWEFESWQWRTAKPFGPYPNRRLALIDARYEMRQVSKAAPGYPQGTQGPCMPSGRGQGG